MSVWLVLPSALPPEIYLLCGMASCAVFCAVVPDRVERNPSVLLGAIIFGPFAAMTIFIGTIYLIVRHVAKRVRIFLVIRNARSIAKKLGVELPR